MDDKQCDVIQQKVKAFWFVESATIATDKGCKQVQEQLHYALTCTHAYNLPRGTDTGMNLIPNLDNQAINHPLFIIYSYCT